jgi:hypothetical protein
MAGFCTTCGNPVRAGAPFCTKCGAAVRWEPSPPEADSPGVPTQPVASAMAQLSSASQAAGVLGAAAGAPWATVVGEGRLDLSALASGFAPLAQSAVRASVRAPAVALILTSLIELGVALASGQPAALRLVAIRAAISVATGVLGVVVGRRGGALRSVFGVFAIVTALVQGVSVAITAVAASGLGSAWVLLPSLVAQLSSLVLAIRSAIGGLRR